MSWLFEDPTTVIVAGVILLTLLAAALLITGRMKICLAMAIVAVVFTGLVLVERWVVTEREQVEAIIHDLAAAIVTQQQDRVVSHISQNSTKPPSLRRIAAGYMANFHIKEVKFIDALEITINANNDPPIAHAQFSVVLVGPVRYPTKLEVWFRKEANHWRVFKYKSHGPRAAFFN